MLGNDQNKKRGPRKCTLAVVVPPNLFQIADRQVARGASCPSSAWCMVHSAWCNGASCPRMKAKPGPLPGHADHFLATALFSSIFERSTSRS